MLISCRTTRQRESKKTASDTSTANTPNSPSVTNTFTPRTNDISTQNTTNTTVSSVKTTPVLNPPSPINTQDTNDSESPSFDKEEEETEPATQMKPDVTKEEKTESPEKKAPSQAAPSTPKGKYDLRASTLVPRDYGTQLDDAEDEDGEKKKVEAVIDLTADDEAEPKVSKPATEKKTPSDDSGMLHDVCFSD